MTISLEHLHSRSPERGSANCMCPQDGSSVIRFIPCLVSGTPEVAGGKVILSVRDNLPEPCGKASKGSGWVTSETVIFTDGKDIFTGWYKRPTRGLLENGRTPYWETVEGRTMTPGEVKGWQRKSLIRITIDR